MKLSSVWSSHDAKQLGEEAGCPSRPIVPAGEDPIKTSIDSLTLPIVYTPISSTKPQPGSTIQSQGMEAVYSMLTIIDDLAESIVGKDKWKLIYEVELDKINNPIKKSNEKLPVLLPLSSVTNAELSMNVTQFIRQINSVTNTISRTQLNLQQAAPIDYGLEPGPGSKYKRFDIDSDTNTGTNTDISTDTSIDTSINTNKDTLNTFLCTAIKTINNLPKHHTGSSEDPGCVLSIPDNLLTFDRKKGVYKLTINDETTLNSILIPGDVVKIFGDYYVLSLSSRMHGLEVPVVEPSFTVKPSMIVNINRIYAEASTKLERQLQLSKWKEEPLFKTISDYPIFSCFTQCASMWSATTARQDLCVVAAFFKGHPNELNHFPLTSTQIVKYLAFYDHKDAVLRFFISDSLHGATPGVGTRNSLSEKKIVAIKELTDNIKDFDAPSTFTSSSFDNLDTSSLSSLTSDYTLETDLGYCVREADEFFSKHDIDDYSFLKNPGSCSPNCSLNSSELLSALRLSQSPADITSSDFASLSQEILSNFHSSLQTISYGISVMYEAPIAISKEYFAWVDATGECSAETLYLYDRYSNTAFRRPLLTLNLRKLFSHYLKKSNNGKSEEHLNGINCMPVVQNLYVIKLPCDYVLLIVVPYMSGSFFFCLFKKDKAPSTADICIVAQKSIIDVVNVDLLQTYGLIFVSTRTFSTDSPNKIKSSTNLHILSLVYNYKESNPRSTPSKHTLFEDINFTVLFKPIHTVFLMNAGSPTKGIVLLDSMRLAMYFESLSYFYIIDIKSLRDYKKHDYDDSQPRYTPTIPVYTACRSISTFLYNRDGEHIILLEQGETHALIYSLNNLKEPKYSITLPGGDRINHAAPGGDSGLIALSGDHTVAIYRLGASEIYLKHYVTRGRAIGIAWSTPTSLLFVTEQALYTISIEM